MRQNLIFSIAAAAALLLAGSPSWAEEEMNPAAMAKALQQSSLPLEKATKVSEREGKPLSAKYEIEKGALQLSKSSSITRRAPWRRTSGSPMPMI